ncbi:ADP-ribosylation factor-like 2-binding protein, domain [Plasmopara halstedii]|uniref:Cilia- and flagella-associated protein 36 n=1 Tax=Plasmopara halstedii TaxID=4781 RepID=A0A0P1AXG0_PLAHL|nr:ADP-ribosylation factor-like 2-binding protein, domain [Plasmopara halstedii]CEG46268.1 ADP-ribosylation factor-like 2-binding protein, domain [Plasmopara halstedii]|eukprot:XP_024582637.1 ADP-ribosylation factor-like 2-binding protein, domain [Plasmopara halstedii]
MDVKIQDPVVRALAEYIKATQFQRQFEQFFLDHALSFTDDLEHQLEYMTIYVEFQQMFNEHMKIFLTQQGVTDDEFVEHCREALKVDPKAEQYLEIVIASMDYNAFYGLMKAMRARASVENTRADSKFCESDINDCGKRKYCKDEKISVDVKDSGGAKEAKSGQNSEKGVVENKDCK